MERYNCVAYLDDNTGGTQFYVRAETDEKAIETAKQFALLECYCPFVFVETSDGAKVYDGGTTNG